MLLHNPTLVTMVGGFHMVVRLYYGVSSIVVVISIVVVVVMIVVSSD